MHNHLHHRKVTQRFETQTIPPTPRGPTKTVRTKTTTHKKADLGMLPKVVKNSFPPTTLGPAVRLIWSPRLSAVSLPSNEDCFRHSKDDFFMSAEFRRARTGLIMPDVSTSLLSLWLILGVRLLGSPPPAFEGRRDDLEGVLPNDLNASFLEEKESNLRFTLNQKR